MKNCEVIRPEIARGQTSWGDCEKEYPVRQESLYADL
jgi:hypothetical protein